MVLSQILKKESHHLTVVTFEKSDMFNSFLIRMELIFYTEYITYMCVYVCVYTHILYYKASALKYRKFKDDLFFRKHFEHLQSART